MLWTCDSSRRGGRRPGGTEPSAVGSDVISVLTVGIEWNCRTPSRCQKTPSCRSWVQNYRDVPTRELHLSPRREPPRSPSSLAAWAGNRPGWAERGQDPGGPEPRSPPPSPAPGGVKGRGQDSAANSLENICESSMKTTGKDGSRRPQQALVSRATGETPKVGCWARPPISSSQEEPSVAGAPGSRPRTLEETPETSTGAPAAPPALGNPLTSRHPRRCAGQPRWLPGMHLPRSSARPCLRKQSPVSPRARRPGRARV